MGRKQLKEFVIDPKSDSYSASRLGLMVMVCMDVLFAIGYFFGINRCPQWAVAPVCIMLGTCTGAVAGVYWGSTYTAGGSWMAMGGAMGISIPPIIAGIPRAKKKGETNGI